MSILINNGKASKGITFPPDEHDAVRGRFGKGLKVYTLRVSTELGRYSKGDLLQTEWGDAIRVTSVKRLRSVDEYPYSKELPKETLKFLKEYTRIDWITLEPTGVEVKEK